jgi:hypothetical protein
MEFRFLLSLIGLLAGLWLYLYRTILEETATAPAGQALVFLGFMHFAVLTYLVLALYIFYCKGRGEPRSAKTKRRLSVADGILLETWPLMVVGLALSFVVSKTGESEFAVKSVMLILAAIGVGVLVFRSIRPSRDWDSNLAPMEAAWFFGTVGLGGLPYIMVMSIVLADVQITMDKQTYAPTEPVILSVRAAGYIFRPMLRRITFGSYLETGRDGWSNIPDETILVPPDEHGGRDFIMVDFEPQILPIRRAAYATVAFIRPPQQK